MACISSINSTFSQDNQFTIFYYLPGKRDTTVRETVNTDIRILSASGSKTVPNTDFWFLKFLAMNPSSYKINKQCPWHNFHTLSGILISQILIFSNLPITWVTKVISLSFYSWILQFYPRFLIFFLFLKPIFVSLGGSRNQDSTVSRLKPGTTQWEPAKSDKEYTDWEVRWHKRWSEFQYWLGSFCCVLGQDTSLTVPLSTKDYELYWKTVEEYAGPLID